MAASAFKLDFESVDAAALSMAHILLPEWIGGKRKGHEWVGERKANGGPGDSWSINLNSGKWIHGAGNEAGCGVTSMYAAYFHLNQGAALKELASRCGIREGAPPIPVLTHEPVPEEKPDQIPAEPPPIRPNPKFGEPTATYRYGNAFVVARYDTPEGKTFTQWTWRDGKWAAKGYPDPKPLFGVERLAEHPGAAVLIVEGEKCALAAQRLLPNYVVLTWAGGAGAVKKSNWRPLKGREVIIWPDADAPGGQAAATIGEILSVFATRIRTIMPDRSDGWDIADAIDEGWSAKQVTKWAGKNIKQTFPVPDRVPDTVPDEPAPAPDTAPAQQPAPPAPILAPAQPAPLSAAAPDTVSDNDPKTAAEAPSAALTVIHAVTRHRGLLGLPEGSAPVNWQSLALDLGEGGQPYPTLANASAILQIHPTLRGHIWFDRFTGKIYHDFHGAPAEWSDDDDADLTVSIQQSMRLPKFNLDLIALAVGHAARLNSRNSLTEWLESLVWDGTERLEHWLSDTLGVEKNAYSMAIGRNWPISMVARAFRPGCQVDTMPVLEGKMGRGKTNFLTALGHPWYASLPIAFGDKDFLQAIQGHWLIEIPDMAGFSRREHTQILATITVRSDVYRPSYGRRTISHPRVAVFAASSENDDYLQDNRGRRRFWPLRCTAIDLDALACQREQIFAESVAKYRAGDKWHEMPESADLEQIARAAPDLWTDRVLDYATFAWEEGKRSGGRIRITSSDLLKNAIDMAVSHQTDAEKRRIARIMREGGWIQQNDGHSRFWKKPERMQ